MCVFNKNGSKSYENSKKQSLGLLLCWLLIFMQILQVSRSLLFIIPQFLLEKEHIFCWVVFAGSVYCVTVSQAATVKMYLCFLWEAMKLQWLCIILFHPSSKHCHWDKILVLNWAESWSLLLATAAYSTWYILMSLNSVQVSQVQRWVERRIKIS